ncbi:type VII secretion-associated protein [Corynebacterium hindlerae]|uniref:Type VII secretion-associated protein n=1 Tax=Corynebacterium hindlerae TaxID=699041 RepID=A0A7G5FHK4_9CORY|nr:type VII secretion-associated protein [Corynebacterium hindlerae]QMV86095.1 type VII secretion-associated protein [Corynebacterium hindlerae]
MKLITVTVLENATIFEAEEQIHRYDLPCSGILAGWAVAAVVDQLKVMADGVWPDIEVAITGPDRAVEVLTRTLLNKSVAAYNADEVETDHQAPKAIRRPTKGRRKAALPTVSLFHVAVALVIITVLVLSWWGIDSQPHTTARAENPVATASPTPSHGVVMEYERVRLTLPPGFRIGPREDGILVATGEDPNMRILIAVDNTYGVDAGAIRTEISSMVASDPTLEERVTRNLRPNDPTVEYLETPGDGSTVAWVVWVTAGQQFSVGCHSKGEPTIAQKAACTMAVESLGLS